MPTLRPASTKRPNRKELRQGIVRRNFRRKAGEAERYPAQLSASFQAPRAGRPSPSGPESGVGKLASSSQSDKLESRKVHKHTYAVTNTRVALLQPLRPPPLRRGPVSRCRRPAARKKVTAAGVGEEGTTAKYLKDPTLGELGGRGPVAASVILAAMHRSPGHAVSDREQRSAFDWPRCTPKGP